MHDLLEYFEIAVRITALNGVRRSLEHKIRLDDERGYRRLDDVRSLRSLTDHLITLRAQQIDMALNIPALRYA